MKKLFIAAFLILTILIAGCDNPMRVKAPEKQMRLILHERSVKGGAEKDLVFDYKNRTYMPYAIVSVAKRDMGECIGFLMQEGEEPNDDVWIINVKAYENEDILIDYLPYGIMEVTTCYRAIDTRGKALTLPKNWHATFFEQDGEFWANENGG